MPKKQRSLGELAARHLRAREAGKRAYRRAELALDEIVKRAKVGQEIELGSGKKVALKDLYAEENKVYRAHGIARYELKELPQ